jgi:hypothetical protein
MHADFDQQQCRGQQSTDGMPSCVLSDCFVTWIKQLDEGKLCFLLYWIYISIVLTTRIHRTPLYKQSSLDLDAKNVPDAARRHSGGPIHLGILSRLEIDDLLALGSTCKQARLSLQQILRNFYNINKQLEPWFTDPKAFRSFQAQCNILIGRTFASWFFSRYRMAKHTDPCLYFDKKYLDTVR